jgi:hypothetical protein
MEERGEKQSTKKKLAERNKIKTQNKSKIRSTTATTNKHNKLILKNLKTKQETTTTKAYIICP